MLQTVAGGGPKCQDFCRRRGFEERHAAWMGRADIKVDNRWPIA